MNPSDSQNTNNQNNSNDSISSLSGNQVATDIDVGVQAPKSVEPTLKEARESKSISSDMTQDNDVQSQLQTESGDDNSKNSKKSDDKAEDVKQDFYNLHYGEDINLVLRKSKEAIEEERKSLKINYSAALSVLLLTLVSVVIAGVNFYFREQLGGLKDEELNLQQEVTSRESILVANNRIVDRIILYRDIQEGTFSPKEVLEYWDSLTAEYGEIDSIEISNGLNFTFTGSTDSLENVAFLWHRLSVDERVETINLDSFSIGQNASYEFTGTLDREYFVEAENELSETEEE